MAMENAYAETQRGIERSHAIDAQRSGTTVWVSAFLISHVTTVWTTEPLRKSLGRLYFAQYFLGIP